MAAGFSSIMKLTDLNDFIAPSLECIKPVVPSAPPKGAVKGLIQVDDGADTPQAPVKATISLSDCLACSGCVTSAEVVLVSQQSSEQLKSVLRAGLQSVVVSLAPQAVVSVAHTHGLQPQECARRLAGYFFSVGCEAVWDTSLARSLSLLEVAKEVATRCQQQPGALPLLASACPGWVCYAEKTQPQTVLEHISRTRSPQQIMGLMVNNVWAPNNGKELDKVYHVTLMPCYDKKLEASRLQFEDELTKAKEVDCVITPVELEQLFRSDGTVLSSVPPADLSPLLSSSELMSHAGSSSGGYADFVLRYLATTLYNTELPEVQWKTLRNADLLEAELEVEGQVVARVCRAYGFRNLQNVVQKVKRGQCKYQYVEVMACPGGCLNGGGQVPGGEGVKSSKQLLSQLDQLYTCLPQVDPIICPDVEQIHKQLAQTTGDQLFAHTSYTAVEKNTTALAIKW